MKKTIAPLALIPFVLACGGSAETHLDSSAADAPPIDVVPEDARPTTWDGEPLSPNAEGYYDTPELPLGADPNRDYHAPYRIAEVKAGGATVQFISVISESESGLETQSVMIRVHGEIALGNPVDRLRQAVGLPLTSAEIYMGLTGEDTAPVELLGLQRYETAATVGRTPEFIDVPFIDTLEAPQLVDKADLMWVFTDVPGYRWHTRFEQSRLFCPFSDSFANCRPDPIQYIRALCAGINFISLSEFPRNNAPGHCNSAPDFLRLATWNHSHNRFDVPAPTPRVSYVVQDWYQLNAVPPWRVNPAISVEPQQFFVADWATFAPKKYAVVVNRTENPGVVPFIATGVAVPR